MTIKETSAEIWVYESFKVISDIMYEAETGKITYAEAKAQIKAELRR
jgi:hypothetical protein